MLKRCKNCRAELPLDLFYVKEVRNGKARRFNRCAACLSAFNHRPQELKRKRQVAHPPEIRRLQQRAWSLLDTAVWKGRVTKPESCSMCGRALAKKNIEGHHDDYGKPYEVRWVCRSCHEDIHGVKK